MDPCAISHCRCQLYGAYSTTSVPNNRFLPAVPGMTSSLMQAPIQAPIQAEPNRPYFCTNPIALQGSRCYVDVSRVPDDHSTASAIAGIGIFILNFQVHPAQSIYIKARMHNCHSVLMGEAAALALGAKLVQALQISSCFFLSDSQQLVQFLHSANKDHPPHWRMKPYTQVYDNVAGNLQTTLFKITRISNSIADTLAKQALVSTLVELDHSCSRLACGLLCSTLSRAVQCTNFCSFLLRLIYFGLFLVKKNCFSRCRFLCSCLYVINLYIRLA